MILSIAALTAFIGAVSGLGWRALIELQHTRPLSPWTPATYPPHKTRTVCTSPALTTTATINRGNEGIWVVKPNITDLRLLYSFEQVDWQNDNTTAVLNACSDICKAGNSTEGAGQWSPSEQPAEGIFVNTPRGRIGHPLWRCACYDRSLSQNDLVPGGGVEGSVNPGSGYIINRNCTA